MWPGRQAGGEWRAPNAASTPDKNNLAWQSVNVTSPANTAPRLNNFHVFLRFTNHCVLPEQLVSVRLSEIMQITHEISAYCTKGFCLEWNASLPVGLQWSCRWCRWPRVSLWMQWQGKAWHTRAPASLFKEENGNSRGRAKGRGHGHAPEDRKDDT